jgi:kynureninase
MPSFAEATIMTAPSRDDCAALDRRDPLARYRDQFLLPRGIIYLDGNSLGALPRAAPETLSAVLREEWGEGLIRSWNRAGWIAAPERLGDRLAPLIGASAGEVVVTDSTSVNLFKLVVGALRLRPGRRLVISEAGNFPTDLYVAQGAIEVLGRGHELRLVEAGEVEAALSDEVALVMLSHVDFKTAAVHDMAAVTAAAHRAGALMLWDLAHSAGALAVELGRAGADLAVGCGYKFLNGGPGAPAFLYVAKRLQAELEPVLTGWMGHARPFDFATDYVPAPGIRRNLCGTPPILSLAALEAALDLWRDVDLAAVRRKSMAMGELFIGLVEERCRGLGFALASPRDGSARGSQVSFRHAQGYAITQALIARGVIGDFRTPDLLRFGFAPLYTRYVDLWDAVDALAEIMASGAWDRPEFRDRAFVT